MIDVIAKKRDGLQHTEEELRFVAEAAATGSVPDYQLSAWLMAAFLNPLDEQETAWLTRAMAESGERLDLTALPKPWVDKHSTGGVGDKTTLVLLPMLAACGLTVVKMSGRGLGITGGTIDKLGSVPGFRLDLSPEEMKEQAARIGLALTGQTPNLAPADKALYSLRDVTGTVGSIPLIVSSILSKKLAGGAETIILDVKCGSGAFMTSLDEAKALRSALLRTGELLGLTVRASISDMTQPLGRCVGNALEVREALEVLRGEDAGAGMARFKELCVTYAALTLSASGHVSDEVAARTAAEEALSSGKALQKAREWFRAQGANPSVVAENSLPEAPVVHQVAAPQPGWVGKIDARTVAEAVLGLGGGRMTKEDQIDPAVGVEVLASVGHQVSGGDPLFTIHAGSEESAQKAAKMLASGLEICDKPVAETPLFLT